MIQPRNAKAEVCCAATMSNLLVTSLKDYINQSKTPPNSDTKVHAKISHYGRARGPRIEKNCLLPFIVFIMLCSVVNGDPPTALTSGLLNTAATGDTTIAGGARSYGYTSQTTTGMPQSVYIAMNSINNVADNIKIFTHDLSMACKATSGLTNVGALVIKGPGKVFAGSYTDTSRLFYTVSHTAATYLMTLTSTRASAVTASACGDEDSTNSYVYVTSDSPTLQISKIDLTSGVETTPVSIVFANECSAGPNNNYVVMTGNGSMIYLRSKSDMSDAGTATRSGGPPGITSLTTIDNLTTGMLYYFSGSGTSLSLVKADLNTATASVVSETMVWIIGRGYGSLDRPLNFGPYQYVVTLTVLTPSAYVLVIDKTTNMPAVLSSFATRRGINYDRFTIAGTMTVYKSGQFRAYITAIANQTTGNFNVQSYYLTVDRCVNRDGSLVCQECLPGYYRVGTAANNLCKTTAEFPAGTGIVVGMTPALADVCTMAGCIDCVSDNIGCTACAKASGWYLNANMCQHASLSPKIPLGFGPNLSTGLIKACVDSNCKICTANYQTCTECVASSKFEQKGIKCELRSSYIIIDKGVEKISSAMSKILGFAAFIGRLVVAPFSYGAAFISQSLTSQLLILATLDGPEVSRSESVLRSVTHLARWFPTGNPFGTWSERASCQQSSTMERNQFTCSLVGNMGAHFVMLLIIGFVCTLITVISIVVMAKANSSSTKARAVMSWLRSNFGISFMLSLGNALQFELLFYSLHNFAKSSNSSVMIFSDFIGATVIACLALSMAIQIYLAVWIWRQIKKTARVAQAQPEEQQSEPSAKKSVQLLRDTVYLKSVPRGIGSFACLFSEHKMPTRFYQLLIGSGLSLKNVIQSIVILSASDKPALQVILVLVAELAYMILYVISRQTASYLLFGVHVINHSCMVIFMILKLASSSMKLSQDTREGPL